MAELGEYRGPILVPKGKEYSNCLDVVFFIEMYLEECSDVGVKPTLSGLALAIGRRREEIVAWTMKDSWGAIVTSYRDWVQRGYEEHLFGNSQVSGAIFALKNMGASSFSDSKNIQIDGNLTVSAIAGELTKAIEECVIDAEYVEVQSDCVALPGTDTATQSQNVMQCEQLPTDSVV